MHKQEREQLTRDKGGVDKIPSHYITPDKPLREILSSRQTLKSKLDVDNYARSRNNFSKDQIKYFMDLCNIDIIRFKQFIVRFLFHPSFTLNPNSM